jgi:2-polyprenyl-6-methoxyphenol hydroxylase-like FAD-dependent oxidoreductase
MAMSHYGHRAIVIGSGIGGLAAAGALMPHFEDVVVLERDRLEAAPKSRPGTPQDRHPHGLLAGGVTALDELFPRFSRDLADAGAVLVRMNADVHHDRGSIGLLPRRDLGVTVPCASRPLIEWTLRRQVEASANITIRSGCRVTEIVPGQASAHGVMFQSGREPPETLDADLVIDASGRGALMLDLLNKLNWDIPETTEIGVDISYSTVLMKLPPDQLPDWKAAFAMQAHRGHDLDRVVDAGEERRARRRRAQACRRGAVSRQARRSQPRGCCGRLSYYQRRVRADGCDHRDGGEMGRDPVSKVCVTCRAAQ